MKPNIEIPHQRLHLVFSGRFVDHLGAQETLDSPRPHRAWMFIPEFVPTILWLCSSLHDPLSGPFRDERSLNGVE